MCLLLFLPDAKGSIREIILPKGLDLDRPKRTRTSFTAEQLYRLEMEFQRCQYVVGRERTELARQLNLSETQVLKIQMYRWQKKVWELKCSTPALLLGRRVLFPRDEELFTYCQACRAIANAWVASYMDVVGVEDQSSLFFAVNNLKMTKP